MIVAADETGRVLDVEPLNYVRKIDGVWAPCKPECAQAICKYNQLYSIDPDNPVPLHDDNDGDPTEGETTAPFAVLYEVEDGSLTVGLLHLGDAHTAQITDLEAAAMEIADSVGASATDTDAALMEIGDTLAALMEQKGE